MHILAITAEQIGFWGDKLIGILGVSFCAGIIIWRAGKKRSAGSERMETLEAEREADLGSSGPPRFNG